MKAIFNGLQCPHCGSQEFDFIDGEVFVCEFCKQKTSFNLDEIDFDNGNSFYKEELKTKLSNRVEELYQEKKKHYDCLMTYKKLERPNLLFILSCICLAFAICFLFTGYYIVYAIICVVVSIIFVVLAFIYKKKKYLKFHPYVIRYAKNVADCQREINAYTRLISKLTD